MRVPLLDLARQPERVRQAVADRVNAVFDSQQFILGKAVEDFERAFSDYVGVAHSVGMSSGTDAQLAILMAMGVGEGDAIITSPYTFFATAGCIHRVGAETVFIDIEPDTLHIDSRKIAAYLAQCQRDADGNLLTARGNKIRAVIPIHLFGLCCDMDALRSAIGDLPIIEDAAQAIGAQYQFSDGRVASAGDLGESAYFSFFPTKNLGAAGDAGMSVCNADALAQQFRLVRNHGMEQRYFHRMVGGNFRLDAVQAAVLHAKLPEIEEWNAARRCNADLYRAAFSAANLLDRVTLPVEPWKSTGLKNHHTYHQYVLRAQRRDDLLAHLAKSEIGHAVYYPVPLHLQECFGYLGYREGDLPESERAAKESVALAIFPGLREDEISAVVDAFAAFYR